MSWLKNELNAEKYRLGLVKKQVCTESEEKILRELEQSGKSIPDNVFKSDTYYWRYVDADTDVTDTDIQTLCALKQTLQIEWQTQYIKTIKNCAVFFTVCAVVSAVLCVSLLPHFKEFIEALSELL